MLPYHPLLHFNIGPVRLNTWGLFLSLSFLAVLIGVNRWVKKISIKSEIIFDLGFWMMLSAIIGSRILFVLESWKLFTDDWWGIIKIWDGGMSMYGGVVGAVLAFMIFSKIKKLPIWQLADIFAFWLPLGIGIGRVGCALIIDHIGKITSAPWAIDYFGQPRHDVGIYLSLNGFLAFGLFWLLKRFKFSQREGFWLMAVCLWKGVSRFLLDFLRADDLAIANGHYWGLTLAQYISIGIFLIGLVIWFKKVRSGKSL